MKRMTTVIVLVMAMFGSVIAQTTQTPDFKNSPMLIKADGSLVKLEKQNSEIKTKSKNMGYGGTSTFINIDGKNSTVRVSANATFMLKVDADVDPETVFYITPAKEVNKTREVEMTRVSAYAAYGAKTKSVKKDDISVSFTKVADGVYKITPDAPLTPGMEYAFVNATQGSSGGQSTVFCFGVDQ
jgi:hypothetical protein